MVADKFVFPNDDSSDLGKESKKFLALVSSYFTDVFSKFCWNFKVYLLIQWGRHVWASSTDSTCLPADPLAISLAFKKEQVPPLIASAGPVSLLSAALSHWRRRHFRKSENSGLHLSPKPLSYNPKECFQSLNHHPASASISSAAVFRCFFFSCWTSCTRTKLHSHHRISPSPAMFYQWCPRYCWSSAPLLYCCHWSCLLVSLF